MEPLPQCKHWITNQTHSSHLNGLIVNFSMAVCSEQLTFENYQNRLATLLFMEEHQTDVDMELYTMENVTMKKHGHLLSLEASYFEFVFDSLFSFLIFLFTFFPFYLHHFSLYNLFFFFFLHSNELFH